MKSLYILSFVLLTAAYSAGQQPKVTVLPGSSYIRQSSVSQGGTQHSLTVLQKDAQVQFAKKSGYVRVYSIHDSQTHLFWWISFPGRSAPAPEDMSDQTASFLDSHFVRFIDAKMVVFWPTIGFAIKILASSAVCDSDQQCWDLTQQSLDESALGDYFQSGRGITTVDLQKHFGEDFAIRREERLSAAPRRSMPQIDSIEHVADGWEIQVEGPNKDKGTVVLNDKFEVLKTARLDTQK